MRAVDEDRAQLMLAGAFILATALIGLSIVLSAGNYTAALAGESGTVAQGDDAATARASVAADARSYLPIVNARSTTYSSKQTAFSDVFDLVGERTQRIYASQGRVVTLGSPGFDEGTRIKQTNDETFLEPGERGLSDSPSTTWDLTYGGTVRNLTFHFSQLPLPTSSPFTLQFRQAGGATGSEWDVNVQRGAGDWEIEVEEVGGSAVYTCERTTTPTAEKTMDISDAEMDGSYCRALDQLEMGSTDYRLVVRTPSPSSTTRQHARGKFWLVVTEGDALTPPVGTAVETDSDLVYSATVPFTYRSEAVAVESDLRVAPGEIE